MIKVLKYLFSSRSLPIIVCTSLMLFFLGTYFMIAFKSRTLVETLKNETNVLIEVESGIDRDLVADIALIPGVIKGSIKFTSKEEAQKLMQKELGSAFIDLEGENPFYDTYQVNVKKSELKLAAFSQLKGVRDAYAQHSYVDQIQTNVRKFSRLALVVGIFFSALAVTLIFNAIKLSLTESKSAFYTLKLLGSDWNFIKKPFLQRSFYSGLLSGGIAVLLFILALAYLMVANQTFRQIISAWNIVIVIFFMMLIGFLVNILSTNAILNRFLAMKEEDLYT